MKSQAHLEIEMVPVEELCEYEGNAKLHPADHVEQIAASIEEFNFADPLACWHDEDGNAVIIEGHGRLLAARKLGIDELPVIFLDYLSDEQRRAYTLVHNQLTMNTGFDLEILKDELDAITEIDMGQFDFSFDVPTFDDGPMEGDDANEVVPSVKNTSEEIDLEEFDDEQFEHTCPRCGFRFDE